MARKLIGSTTGWIKPKHYGIDVEDGIEYIILFAWWQKPILRLTCAIQKALWLVGVAVHNPVAGECTPDFNCCCKIGRFTWLRVKG